MISPPAANLIVRNGEEIRGCGRITVYQRSSRVYIGTLSLCEPTIEGDHWSQGTVFGGRSPILASLGFHFFCRGFSPCRCLLPACQGQKPVLNLRSVHCMRSLCCRPDFAEYETGKQLQARRKWRRILTDCCLTKVTSDCLSLQITYTN